jgi:hypothetical protein
MDANRRIKGFWSYLFFVVLKPWLWFWIAGVVMTTIYAATWIRDNILSEEVQKEYATQKLLPHWQIGTWALTFGALALCSVIRNGFIAWRTERAKCEALERDKERLKEEPLPLTAPQVGGRNNLDITCHLVVAADHDARSCSRTSAAWRTGSDGSCK